MGLLNKLIFLILTLHFVYGTIVNNNVERTLDISTQLVKESIKISAQSLDNESFRVYKIVIPTSQRKHLAYFSAKDVNMNDIKVVEENFENNTMFILNLPSASVNHVINIEKVFINLIEPYPKEIKQNEKQLVKFNGQLHFFSPYLTKTQKTTVQLSGNYVSFSQIKPFSESSNKIKYGPYEDIQENSSGNFYVHYENQTPFLTVSYLERIIEISHWGNIAVKEEIHITHTGALLKGPFSRYELQKDGRSGLAAVKSYKTILPASASDVYYRDNNGNISTSNLRVLGDAVELELRPRFPLFGGWKNYYILGYNVPSYEYLFNLKDKYVLQMRVIDHIFDDMVIDEVVVKVVLPEGSLNFEIFAPYEITRHTNGILATYLDTVGRPVIVFSKSNLLENHIADFQLKYEFNKAFLLCEPLLAFAFIYAIFLVCIIFLRIDCNISQHLHKE